MVSSLVNFDKASKLRLSFEEWLKNEFEMIARQHEDQELVKVTRFIAVDALIQRNERQVGALSYIFTEENIWVIFSQPVFRKLDDNTISLFLKVILQTIFELKNSNDKKNIRECEIRAYNKIVEDLDKLSRSENLLNQIDRMKQAIFFLSTQLLKARLPVVNPETLIPVKSDNLLMNKINNAFSKIRTKLYNSIDPTHFDKAKFRILPYYFKIIYQDLNNDRSELRVKPIVSLDIYDVQNSYSFSLFIINTYFLETIDLDDLELLLAYELISLINNRKFSRGEMEKEIHSIITKEKQVDENYDFLKSFYDSEFIKKTRIKINKKIEEDLSIESTPVLRIE